MKIKAVLFPVEAAAMIALALAAGPLLERAGIFRVDLSRTSLTRLKPETLAALRNLKGSILITCYLSDRDRLPSNMRTMPADIEGLLAEMRRQSHHRLTYRFIDPSDNPELRQKLGYKRIAPFSVQSIDQDEFSVNTIWSGMLIQYQGKERVIATIAREHLPSLQDRILRHLKDIESPQPVKIALSFPWPDKGLRYMISTGAKLINFEFDRQPIPPQADLAFLVQPRLNKVRAQSILDFLADGKSVFLFFSPCHLAYRGGRGSPPRVSIQTVPLHLEALLEDLGVEVPPQLAFDTQNLKDNPSTIQISPFGFDLSRFRVKLVGNVITPVASPIVVNPARAKAAGWNAEVLAHTTMMAWSRNAPATDLPWEEFIKPPAGPWERRSVNVGVMLRRDAPWHGKLFLYSSQYIFDDGAFSVSPGNFQYMRNLLMTVTAEEYRPGIRSSGEKPPALPPLSGRQKGMWRLLCVGLSPMLLFAVMVLRVWGPELVGFFAPSPGHRDRLRGPGEGRGEGSHVPSALTLPLSHLRREREQFFLRVISPLLPLLLLSLIALWPKRLSPLLDCTKERLHALDPESVRILGALPDPVSVTYVTSPASEMSVAGKQMIANLRDRLDTLARRAGSRFRVHQLDISREKRRDPVVSQGLARMGIEPFTMQIIEKDAYQKRPVYSALILETAKRREIITPIPPATEYKAEFLVDAALGRLFGAPRLGITLIAEQPRLTPAEALMEYAQWQQPIPQSSDVYSQLRALFHTYGYAVQTLSPQEAKPEEMKIPVQVKASTEPIPEVGRASATAFDASKRTDVEEVLRHYGFGRTDVSPESEQSIRTNLLVYLQPFTLSDKLKSEIDRHLLSGRNVIVAAQHFDIQERVYKGRAFKAVYWPKPQFSRINEWLDHYGIELKREILFDRSKKQAEMETQVRWGAILRESRKQLVSLPFLIYAIPEQFNKASEITAHLSDQLFIGGNRWIRDAGFPKTLTWTPLITTSELAWSFFWKAGWIPDSALAGGPPFKAGQPLGVLVEGLFPSILRSGRIAEKPARMVLIGCSAMFQNDYLQNADFRAADLFMNAVVELTYGPEMARIHARSTPIRAGFGYLSPSTKMLLRLWVIVFYPFAFVLFGFWRRLHA